MGEERGDSVEELEGLEAEVEWKKKNEHPFGNKHETPPDDKRQMGQFCLPRADQRQIERKAYVDGMFHSGGDMKAGDPLSETDLPLYFEPELFQRHSWLSFTITAAGREARCDQTQAETHTAVRRERMRLAQRSRKDLELNGIQHWVFQPRHVHCRSVRPRRAHKPVLPA
ncbi:hypothetical protein AOLI_G00164830 [Acnodon oligacanthus]